MLYFIQTAVKCSATQDRIQESFMSSKAKTTKAGKNADKGSELTEFTQRDFSKLTEALVNAAEKTQPLLQDYFTRHTLEEIGETPYDPFNIRKSYLEYMVKTFSNPTKFIEMQMEYWDSMLKLWQNSMERFVEGEEKPAVFEAEPGDRRFRDKIWHESALFDFIKQSYILTSKTIMDSVYQMENLDPVEKQKIEFFAKQYVNAIAPNNFILTNPEVLEATIESGGDNLVKGMENLLSDLERGGGNLKISTTDYEAFEVGKNIATTEGKVIYQNELMQLIQYSPQTEEVFEKPLLIIPPWINKYYILDMRPENSLIKWLVNEGHTVFIISWVNPTKDLADKNFEDYMSQGPFEAIKVIKDITNQASINVIGYCLGGTLLASVLAWYAASEEDTPVSSSTFLTTMVDFEKAGDMKVFIDEEQIQHMENKMARQGYLEADAIKKTFSMLRSTDLIWSFVVNNYLLGKEPFPFDLLYWNDDSTNMPAKMHSFYLRQMYLENKLSEPDALTLCGKSIDMRKVKTPSYFLSTREDHIAPWKATYVTTQLFSGPKKFTLAASGHIAGVVNPPQAEKYCHFVNSKLPEDPEKWINEAKEQQGSWWPHWQNWIKNFTGNKVKAREPGSKKYKPIEEDPGSYVKVRY